MSLPHSQPFSQTPTQTTVVRFNRWYSILVTVCNPPLHAPSTTEHRTIRFIYSLVNEKKSRNVSCVALLFHKKFFFFSKRKRISGASEMYKWKIEISYYFAMQHFKLQRNFFFIPFDIIFVRKENIFRI